MLLRRGILGDSDMTRGKEKPRVPIAFYGLYVLTSKEASGASLWLRLTYKL